MSDSLDKLMYSFVMEDVLKGLFIYLPPGYVACVYDLGRGVLKKVLTPGLHFKIPFWRNAQEVVDNHDFILYERGGNDKGVCTEKGIDKKTTVLQNVPVLEISSTFIREQIKNNGSLKHLLPEAVINHIHINNLYK